MKTAKLLLPCNRQSTKDRVREILLSPSITPEISELNYCADFLFMHLRNIFFRYFPFSQLPNEIKAKNVVGCFLCANNKTTQALQRPKDHILIGLEYVFLSF
jgi:hypothetical protein